jgi:hypothetical protein
MPRLPTGASKRAINCIRTGILPRQESPKEAWLIKGTKADTMVDPPGPMSDDQLDLALPELFEQLDAAFEDDHNPETGETRRVPPAPNPDDIK